jgi:hypothetical protein
MNSARGADELMKDGDLDGQRVWRRIVRAIKGLATSCAGAMRAGSLEHFHVLSR